MYHAVVSYCVIEEGGRSYDSLRYINKIIKQDTIVELCKHLLIDAYVEEGIYGINDELNKIIDGLKKVNYPYGNNLLESLIAASKEKQGEAQPRP